MSDVKYPLSPSNVVQSSSCHPPPPPTPPSFNDNDNFHVSSNRIPQHDVDHRYLEQQHHNNNHQQSVNIATTSTDHLATTARGSNQDEDPDLAMARRNRPLSFSSLSRDEVEKPSGGSGSGSGTSENGGQRQVISISTPDPSHLFWVPATQHPEIAPAEFEKFLQINAMAKRERASLRRRSSILSVSFTASDAEQEQEEGVTRDHLQQQPSNNSSDTSGEQQHHQGLDENESQRKTRLRRSISLGTISAAESQMRLPDFLVFDRNSSTEDQSRVLVPRADRSSLLRRGARTRFQRNSSFTPSAPRRPVDRHRQAESMPPVPFNRDIQSFEGITLSDKPLQEDHQQQPHLISRPETEKDDEHIQSLAVGDNVPTRPSSTPPITPSSSISEPTFQRQQQQQQQEQQQHEPSSTLSPSPSPSPSPPPPPPPPHSHAIDRGEKKSSWSWGFRKNKSDQLKQEPIITASSPSPSPPTAAPEPRPSVSTDSTSSSTSSKKFGLSSLFSRKGSSSKVQPANVSMVPTNAAGANGTAVPKDFQLNRINQNRLPIHIERAIYRLSHTKLANPRRPLHEQVLISNLMFWYLSVVSSTQPNGSVEAGRKFVSAGKKGKRQPQQQQQNRPASNNNNNKTSNHRPSQQQQQQQQQQNTTLHQYMGNNASTGFVIPENYLRPKGGGPKHRKPSLSDSDEDDDDDDSSSSDSSSDEETTKKAHTMTTAKKPSTRPNIKGPALINHTQGARKERDDDIPLAMYKSKGRV